MIKSSPSATSCHLEVRRPHPEGTSRKFNGFVDPLDPLDPAAQGNHGFYDGKQNGKLMQLEKSNDGEY